MAASFRILRRWLAPEQFANEVRSLYTSLHEEVTSSRAWTTDVGKRNEVAMLTILAHGLDSPTGNKDGCATASPVLESALFADRPNVIFLPRASLPRSLR